MSRRMGAAIGSARFRRFVRPIDSTTLIPSAVQKPKPQIQNRMRPYILTETNYGYTKANRYEVAVLPLGATEPHNLHLPYGTDCYEGTIIGDKICDEAH